MNDRSPQLTLDADGNIQQPPLLLADAPELIAPDVIAADGAESESVNADTGAAA